MNSRKVILEARAIRREFRESDGTVLEVLCGVDFDLREGEMIAVRGASGTGKSTLLHILGALDRPSSGEVFFRGESLWTLSSSRLDSYRLDHVGFVFQFHHLLPEFDALENVMVPAMIRKGKNKKADRNRAMELLDLVGVADRSAHLPGELSGGERQRVAVARSLMNQPEIVMADEPSGNLDEDNSARLHELFEKLNRDLGQTFLLVTHDVDLAGRCRRELQIHDGKATWNSHS